MIASIVASLRQHPELAVFLTLALGFLLGRVRVGTFKLGNVVGTLLAGVLIGQLAIKVHPLVEIVFFDLFLFATGYKVGPQFFRGLKKNAVPQLSLTVVLCVTSLVVTVAAAKALGYDCGTAAGLMAGAFTESTVIGTAGDTIARLNLPDAEKQRLLNNIPVAYAVSYLVGTGFVVWFLSSLAPGLLGVDLKVESKKLETKMSAIPAEESGRRSGYREWDLRAYRLADVFANRRIADLEKFFVPERVFIERIRRDSKFVDATPDTVLRAGDIVVVVARRRVLLSEGFAIGVEVEDRELLDFPVTTADVVVTNRAVMDETLPMLAEQHGRGVVLQKLIRGGEEIPFTLETTVQRGDLLRIVGAKKHVERVGKILGYIERPSSETDVVFVGLGIFVGGLVGMLSLPSRRCTAQPHGQRRLADHGSRVRVAAIRPANVRTHPRTSTLGLRHRRPCGLHRRRWLECRARLRHGSARHGAEPTLGGFPRRIDAARDGCSLRTLRVESKPGDFARCLRGRGNGNGSVACGSG